MGFKFKRVDLVGGSEEFPSTGTAYADIVARSKTVLTKCVEALIACNCGWQLDSSRSTSTTDYTMIANRNDSDTYPALFLTNSVSGCKLFISYFGRAPKYGIKDFSGNNSDLFKVSSSASTLTGLCMSIIPAGSDSVFGDPTLSTFLPSDATRIIGTHNCSNTSNTSNVAFAGSPASGNTYSWGIFATSNTIAISCAEFTGSPGALGVPVCALGRIFGTLLHSDDTTSQSKYGCITFRSSSSTGARTEGSTTIISTSTGVYGAGYLSFLGKNPNNNTNVVSIYFGSSNVMGSVSKVDGTWINGTDDSNYGVTLCPFDGFQLSGYIYNSTGNGKSRWVPYVVRCVSTDLSTYGVISGDGMKGYLDTDLFRCAVGTYGQQFDNGNFICIDGTNNLLLGWDPNNDPLVGT